MLNIFIRSEVTTCHFKYGHRSTERYQLAFNLCSCQVSIYSRYLIGFRMSSSYLFEVIQQIVITIIKKNKNKN